MSEKLSAGEAATIERWAIDVLVRLSDGGRRGVLMGGSIARRQQWAHSDLEAGVLTVDAADKALPYFNVDAGRGVEIIQLDAVDLQRQVAQVESGDLAPVTAWPTQLYKARVISDPSGLLQRFATLFDDHLFDAAVVQGKVAAHRGVALNAVKKSRSLLSARRRRAALSVLRHAMNETVVAFHWRHGELPRSQNRMESRLRELALRVEDDGFYRMFRDAFDLDDSAAAINGHWPQVREQVLDITGVVGARAFFEVAVDSRFAWGQNDGILTVYRLYVPLAGAQSGATAGIFHLLDDDRWAADNTHLLAFLGMAVHRLGLVERLADRIEAVAARLVL